MCALREALLLAVLKHPNLVQLHECVYDQKEEILYLFLEFLKDGDLKSHKNNTLYFKQCNIWSLIADVAAGLHYLHKNGVVHRDIKPENIIRSHKTYKITDLNVSRTERAGASIGSVVGSPDYFSPEILQGKGYDFKTDIWSFGIIICQLCNLRNPGSLDNVENIPSCYSLALQTLLQNMVAIEADHRYSAEEILIYCQKYGMTENMQSYIMEIGLEDDINNYRFPETKERFVNIIDSFY